MPDIKELLTPYFKDSTKRHKRLRRRMVEYFSNAGSYKDLESRRLWNNFQSFLGKNYSPETLRIMTQDTNNMLRMMHEEGKIKKIKLPTIRRKMPASAGFDLHRLKFNTDHIIRLWEQISTTGKAKYVLLFAMIICSVIPVRYLARLRVGDVGEDLVTIWDDGLICSILVEPGRTMFFRHVVKERLKPADYVFKDVRTVAFKRWLKRQCRRASVPPISAWDLFYYARYLLVLQGVPGYVAYKLGSKNAFSPFVPSQIKGGPLE